MHIVFAISIFLHCTCDTSPQIIFGLFYDLNINFTIVVQWQIQHGAFGANAHPSPSSLPFVEKSYQAFKHKSGDHMISMYACMLYLPET